MKYYSVNSLNTSIRESINISSYSLHEKLKWHVFTFFPYLRFLYEVKMKPHLSSKQRSYFYFLSYHVQRCSHNLILSRSIRTSPPYTSK
jgi:hypothetical protein